MLEVPQTNENGNDVHEHHNILGPDDFSEEERCIAQKHGVSIDHRYSQTVEDSYFANVCKTCNAFIGEFQLHDCYYIESYKCIEIGYKCFHCIDNKKNRKFEAEQERQRIANEKRSKDEDYTWSCANGMKCIHAPNTADCWR